MFSLTLLTWIAYCLSNVAGFAPPIAASNKGWLGGRSTHGPLRSSIDSYSNISGDFGVVKMMMDLGSGELYRDGTQVSTSYMAMYTTADWNANEVIACWLSQLHDVVDEDSRRSLADKFRELDVDEKTLTDSKAFTEEFVQKELGVTDASVAKKLVAAAEELSAMRNDERFLDYTQFDETKEYEFTLGEGEAIRGFDVAVATMQPGERSSFRIRSDYAYGADGKVDDDGNILIPPFATLCYIISLK